MNPPRVFYKYRPANSYTISMLRNREIKFSYAEEYNDPFDSKVVINLEDDIDSVLRKLEDTPLDPAVKHNVRTRLLNGEISLEEITRVAYKAAKRTIISSCFSTQFDNLLLWSHYAESHKGVCVGIRSCSNTHIPGLKFDTGYTYSSQEPLLSGLFPLYKVNYSDSGIVEWELFKDDIKIFMNAHTNKAKCWEYEDEYRLLVPYSEFNSTIFYFDPRFLVEVYLGCSIEPDFQMEVQQAIRECYLKKGIDVKVFKMVSSKKHFELEKLELEH